MKSYKENNTLRPKGLIAPLAVKVGYTHFHPLDFLDRIIRASFGLAGIICNKANEGTANTLNLFEGDLPFPVCRLVIPTEPLQKNIRRGKPDLIIQRNGSPPLHSVMVVETFDRTP